MGLTNAHGLYAAQVGSTMLPLTAGSLATGTDVLAETDSGRVYVPQLSISAQKPVADFTTRSIGAGLTAIGFPGCSIANLTGGLNLYGQKHADESTRASGAVHSKYALNAGLLMPLVLTLSHREYATLTVQGLITWDGSNDPIIPTHNAALPDISNMDNQRYSLGPVQLESITFNQKISVEINFAVNGVPEGADGDIWDSIISVRTAVPILTMRGKALEWFAQSGAIPFTGKGVTHVNTKWFARKWANNSSYVADGVAEHVKFSAAGLAYIDTAFTVAGSDLAETVLMMPMSWDGTNDPIIITPSQAIA